MTHSIRIKRITAGLWEVWLADYPALFRVDMGDWFSLIPQHDHRDEAREIINEMRNWMLLNFGYHGWMFDTGHNGCNTTVGMQDEEQATAFLLRWQGAAS